MSEQSERITRLQDWIDTVGEWNDALKHVAQSIDKKLVQYQSITDDEQTGEAGIDLLFIRNRLESMLTKWVGEDE